MKFFANTEPLIQDMIKSGQVPDSVRSEAYLWGLRDNPIAAKPSGK